MAQGKDQLGDPSQAGSQQARANIDLTRQALDRTIEAIGGKLTPGQLLMEGLSLLGRGGTSGANKVVELARDHPIPAAVIGVGVGMMIRDAANKKTDVGRMPPAGYAAGYGYEGGFPGVSARTYDEGPGVASRTVHDAKERVAEVAQSARDTVGEAAHTAHDKVADVLDSVEERGARLRESAHVRVKNAKIGFWQTLDQQPLAVGAAAIAAGLIAGLLIPGTTREDEMLGETRDEMWQRAREKGRDVLQKGRYVAEAAVETLKTEAQQQGLTPSAIADKVRTVAHDTVDQVKQDAKREGLIPNPNPNPTS
jgi:hypothetical protein